MGTDALDQGRAMGTDALDQGRAMGNHALIKGTASEGDMPLHASPSLNDT